MEELRLEKSGDYLTFVVRRTPWQREREIDTGGISFGPHVYVIESPNGELGEYHIVKVPGHNTWSGIAQQYYYETHYYIMQTYKKDGFVWGKMLYEIAPGGRWKQALVLLREKIKELQG